MKKFELHHLVGYLPYGVKGKVTDLEENETWYDEIETVCFRDNILTFKDAVDVYLDEPNETVFKPILRPLSDLIKEIEVNGEKITPIDRLNCTSLYQDTDGCLNIGFKDTQKLFEWHFDIYGLIENNLAIDINTPPCQH